MAPFNDEPVYRDALDHHDYARALGDHVLECKPPYVIGVGGNWGAGKTSFLRKVWLYLGGEADDPEARVRRDDWFGVLPNTESLNLIWFNPWQHQFEASPVVALLQEIRRHFSLKRKFFDEAGKITDVAAYAALSMLTELSKASPVPLPKIPVKEMVERGRSYEAEHFAAPLSSQTFREFFEGAIGQVIGKDGRLVIFIDDLDRCEGERAYLLLESLKLYLNAANCVYILGVDQKHLEESVARVLSSTEDISRFRPLAREYLGKMFQCQFLLPVPSTMAKYIQEILDVDTGGPLALVLNDRCALGSNFAALIATLDSCLPHNPRKVKAFLSAWKLYLSLLASQKATPQSIDWRLTIVLNYLAQFEEPLYRKIEESPGFYNDLLVAFCQAPRSVLPNPLFDGLELPADVAVQAAEVEGGFGTSPTASAAPAAGATPSPVPRVFWISRLVREIQGAGTSMSVDTVRGHLLRAGLGLPVR